jgi:hypothetical protein
MRTLDEITKSIIEGLTPEQKAEMKAKKIALQNAARGELKMKRDNAKAQEKLMKKLNKS